MGFQRTFWKYAHRHYQTRALSILPELAIGSWGLFFVVAYAGAFVAGWYPTLVEAAVALFLTSFPLGYCIVHCRIRKEKAKGADALYRKLVSVSSFRRT